MLRSPCTRAPCRVRLASRQGPPRPGPLRRERGEQGAAALSWSSLPGSPAHSSVSDLADAPGRSPDAESRRPREQREALLTPGPSMGLRVVEGLGLLQRSV